MWSRMRQTLAQTHHRVHPTTVARIMKKIYIKTFGCQMNEYDSDKMADVLNAAEGLTPTANPEDADVILFNTCSVREKAQEKVFHDLGRVRHLKQANPELIIGVGGCVASQEGAAIVARAPFVDVVFGPQTLHRLPELIAKKRETGRAQVDISFPEIEKFDHLPPARVEGGAAFVSVMEGCSKYCTFCVVPYTRGAEVSRPFDDVIAEVADLPVQSGSDRILAAMKRGHSVLEFKSIVRKLREQRPDLCLSSDFIVGFPGETEADFEATMKLVQELNFDASFSFIYSKRPGTPAADYPDDVSAELKTQRLMKLQAQIEAQAQEVNRAMIGPAARWSGRTFAVVWAGIVLSAA